MCGFTAAIRRNYFGKSKKNVLHVNTAQSTVQHVRQIFRINGFSDPGADETGSTHLNAYEKEDSNTKNQCLLPLNVFKILYLNRITVKNKHIRRSISYRSFILWNEITRVPRSKKCTTETDQVIKNRKLQILH